MAPGAQRSGCLRSGRLVNAPASDRNPLMRGTTVKRTLVVLAAAIAASLPQILTAQDNVATTVDIANARQANARLMQDYTWNSRTELLEAGKVADMRLQLVRYGPDGQLQRSLLNETGAPLPRGFLRRDIAEH